MRSLIFIIFVSLLGLSACGGGGDEPPAPSGNDNTIIDDDTSGDGNVDGDNPDDSSITELALAGELGEVADVVQTVGGKTVSSGEIIPITFANAEGSLRQSNVGEGNFTLGVAAADPDGLSEVILFVPSVNRRFVLCSADCGSDYQVTLTGINPQLLGLSPGSLQFELFVGDTLNNLVAVDTINVDWQPIQISSISATRSNNTITVNWAENTSVIRYNLYAATEQGLSSENVLSLESGIQKLSILGTSSQFNDALPAKEYQILITGINSEGESGQSTIFTIPRAESSTNLIPVALSDTYNGEEDQELTANVLDNDTDGNEQLLTLTDIIELPVNGTIEFESSGQFIYTPLPNFVGQDRFVYQISDSEGASAQANVIIDINEVNDDPVANNDSYIINIDKTITIDASQLLANDSDVDGDTLTLLNDVISQPSFGDLAFNSDGSLSYSANENYIDSDSFIYQISDGMGGTAQASVFLLLNTSNQPPIAQNEQYQTNEDSVLSVNTIADGILANDTDPNDRTFQLVTPLAELPSHGQVNLAVDGTFSYIPDSNFFGADQFQYQIINSLGVTAQATVSIDIIAQADVPVSNNDNYQVNEDTTLRVLLSEGVLANDVDTDLGTLTVNTVPVSEPSQGSLTLQADGSFSYTANANFTGVDSFSYQVSNESNLTSTSQVFISVSNINDAPVAKVDTYSVDEDSTLNATSVLVNDTDADGDALVIDTTPEVNVTEGSLTLLTDGTFTYVPKANSTVNDSFTYRVTDNNGGIALGVVSLTINAVNDAPTTQPDSYNVDEDIILNGSTVLANDSDIDGDTLTVNPSPVIGVSHGTLNLNTTGSFTYTPSAGYFGSDSFSYEVLDGKGGKETETVTISVKSINDVPVAEVDSYSVDEDSSLNATSVLVNDTDADGDTLEVNTSPVSGVSHGNLTLFANGTFTYLPSGDFSGSDKFTYEVIDNQGGVTQAVATITVTSINDAPTADNDDYVLVENTTLNVSHLAANRLLINDGDVDGDPLTLSITPINNVTNGTLTLNTNGSFSYTPSASFSGNDNFTYQISDSNNATAQASVSLSVTNVNDAPVATDDSYSMTNGFTLSAVNVLTNDSDLDNDTLSISTTPITPSGTGALTLVADGSFTYTPITADPFSFTYQVTDGKGGSDTGQVSIIVNSSNTAPVGFDDAYNGVENHILNGASVLSNDTDAENNSLFVNTTPTRDTIHGDLTLNSDGSFTYVPDNDFVGIDTFEYELDDGNGDTATAEVTLTIILNARPMAQDDTYNVDEEGTLNAETVFINDTDSNGDALTIINNPTVSHGSLTLNKADGSFVYTPDTDFYGVDSFTYQADDGKGDNDFATVTINVAPINDEPTAVSDNYNTDEDTVLNTAVSGTKVIDNDSDIDGDTLTVNPIVISSTSDGDLTLNTDGTFEYSPDVDFVGVDSFTYQLDDGNGGKAEATVNITVASVNDDPIVENDNFTMVEDTVLTVIAADVGQLLANDNDVDGGSLVIDTTPIANVSHGSLLLDTDGGFTYTPMGNFSGTDRFDYQVFDGQGGSTTGTVLITVTNVNDLPITVSDTFNTNEDIPLNGTSLLINDSDFDGDSLSLITTPDVEPSNGSVVLSTDGTFTYTPNMNFFGSDSFDYQVSDSKGGSAIGTVNINVIVVNDAPVADVESVTLVEDTNVVIDVTDNDTDVDGTIAVTTVVITTPPTNGTTVVNATTGDVTYTPTANYNGADSFSYTVKDNEGLVSNSATVTLTITSVNDAPVANAESITLAEDSNTVIDVTDNDTDVDGTITVTTVVITTPPTHGAAVVNATTGDITYTPTADYNGGDSFSYTVKDNDGLVSNAATVTLTVTSVNDAPVTNAESVSLAEDSNTVIDVTDNDTDVDGTIDVTTVVITTAPADGTAVVNGITGDVTYTPTTEYSGDDSFSYTVKDNEGLVSNIATVSLTVASINDAPIAVDQNFNVGEDKTDGYVVGTVVASDLEGHELSYAIIGGDGALFNIDDATGIITVSGAHLLTLKTLSNMN